MADLFHAAGYGIVLVDESATLIAQLREAGRYTLVRAASPERREDVEIEGYTALSTAQTAELAKAVAAAGAVPMILHYPAGTGYSGDPPRAVAAAVAACDTWVEYAMSLAGTICFNLSKNRVLKRESGSAGENHDQMGS